MLQLFILIALVFINYDCSVNKTKNKKRERPDDQMHHYYPKLFIRAKTMLPCFPGRGSSSYLVSGRFLSGKVLTPLTQSPTELRRLWGWSDREQGIQHGGDERTEGGLLAGDLRSEAQREAT